MKSSALERPENRGSLSAAQVSHQARSFPVRKRDEGLGWVGKAIRWASGLVALAILLAAFPVAAQNATIGNRVWYDANANGIQDLGEPGITGVPIYLYTSSGGWVDYRYTDATGSYSFSVAAGSYFLYMGAPGTITVRDVGGDDAVDSDYDPSTRRTAVFTVTSGATDLSWDCGITTQPATAVGNRVWFDANGNGIQDAGESGVAGVTVWFDGSLSTVTDATGAFAFQNILPGSHQLYFERPSGFFFTRIDQGGNEATDSDVDPLGYTASFNLVSGNSNLDVDAGLIADSLGRASIGNRVWYDANANGIQDAGETGIRGAYLILYTSLGNYVNGLETDAAGSYRFTNLPPGDYYLYAGCMPGGITYSPRDQGGDDTADSDFDSSLRTVTFNLPPGAADDSWDLGVTTAPVSIGDRVWQDLNGNGIQDPGEPGLAGIQVYVYGWGHCSNIVSVTDSNGSYQVSNLLAGSYYVYVYPQSGFQPTFLDRGGDDNLDSDIDGFGYSPVIPVGAGTTTTSVDIGMVVDSGSSSSIGNRVWYDVNGNGVQEAGEPGIGGVYIEIRGANGLSSWSTYTDSQGTYSFTGLRPGDYYLTAPYTTPSGTVLSPKDQGADDTIDSDFNPATRQTDSFSLAAATNETRWDLGFSAPAATASIGDRVWLDTNGNGIQDGGEPGIPGVTVILWGQSFTCQNVTVTDSNGNYFFGNVFAGTYQLQVYAPSGYAFTATNQGGDDTVDSDVDGGGVSANIIVTAGSTNLTVDAGLTGSVAPASIGDVVWLDNNANGVQNSGEPGVAGVTVRLYKQTNSWPYQTLLVATTTTDGTGNYSFSGLPPDTSYPYLLEFALPPGYAFTLRDAGSDTADSDADPLTGRTTGIYPGAGASLTQWDAGLLSVAAPSSIGDLAWNDLNGNGTQDVGEPGIAGVTVYLYRSGSYVGSVTTNAIGLYSFTSLPAGSYQIYFSRPAGSNYTLRDQGADDAVDSDPDSGGWTTTFALAAGQNDTRWDAGYVATPITATVGDFVWNDLNGNGQQNAGEAGIPDVTVRLYSANTGTVVGTTTTNASGNYSFSGIAAQCYFLEFVLPSGYAFTGRDIGSDTTDSDADVSTGRTGNFCLSTGQTSNTWDAGMVAANPATLGDKVWLDANNNGIQDGGEGGVSSVTVNLYRAPSTFVSTTTTNASGVYSFANLIPGDYFVEFVKPAGYNFSPIDQGGDDTLDSDANTTTGRSATVTLAGGANNTTVDCGLVPAVLGSIGDRVWMDRDADGNQDAGEPGLPGVTVRLYTGGGSLIGLTTTNASGNYVFGSLVPGSYYVEFVRPSGYLFSPRDAVVDNLDSDPDTTTGRTATFALGIGENATSWDAGMIPQYADLSITKTGPASATPGSNLAFTVTVTNNGPANAAGVTLNDPAPAGLTFVSASAPCAGGFPCAIGALAAGASSAITVTFSVPAGYTAPDPIVNTASVSATTADPDSANNQASSSIPVARTASADLSVTKSGPASAAAGSTVTYTIVVANAGPDDASSVSLADPAPTGLTFSSASAPCSGGFPCALGTVNAGSTRTISVTFTIPPGYTTPNPIQNTATVSSATADPNSGNNSSMASTPLGANPADISVVKSGPSSVTAGTNVTYTLTVTNAGPATAVGVSLADTTPAGLTFVSADPPCAAGFPCSLGDLASGATVTLQVTYSIPAGYTTPDPVVNTATVSSSTTDPNAANNSSSVSSGVGRPVADVRVVKSGPAQVGRGTTLTYTLLVTNAGPGIAQSVSLGDVTPTGLTFASASSPCAGGFPCSLGNIASGSSQTVSVTFNVPAGYAGANPLGNTATVSTTSLDTVPGNDSSTVQTIVASPPTIAKAFSPTSIQSGGSSTVTLTLTNPNSIALTGAAFTDTLLNMSAAGGAVGGTCVGTTPASLTAGATALSFTGITIPANGNCTVTFSVTSSVTGIQPNATSGVATTQTPSAGTVSNTANLTVYGAPAIAKAFSPAAIQAGGSSTVTLTLTNPNASALTGAAFTDTLTNMSAVGGAVGGTCVGTTPASLTAGATALSFTGITIPASGNCTVAFAVTSSTTGVQANLTSGVATTQTPTAGAVSNTANLTVYEAPTIGKAFSPTAIQSGGTSTVTLTLYNGNSVALTGAAFTDTLANMTAAGGAVGGTCAGTTPASLTAGATSLSFSGITIPASGNCTVTFGVTSSVLGVQPNSTSGITSTLTPVAGPPSAVANLTVYAAPTIAKAFSPSSIQSGGSSTVTLTLTNPNSIALTSAAFTDTLLNMSAVGGAVGGTCVGTTPASLAAGATALSFTGITIPANGNCTVAFAVTSSVLGVQPNATSGVTTTQTPAAGTVSNTANLTVYGAPAIAKAFSPAAIQSGGSSTVTLTLTNPNASALTGAAFTDTLTNMSAVGGAVGGTCVGTTPASLTAGATALSFTGITIPASGNCTVAFAVTSTTTGVQANMTSGVATTQTPTAGAVSNIANLTVYEAPTIGKAFSPAAIQSGGTSTVTLTLYNGNSVALTGAAFTDTLANMTAAGGAVGGTCAGTTPASLTAGATSLSFSGITIPASGNCTVTFGVTSSVLGVNPNSTSGITTTQTPVAGPPSAVANLTVYGAPAIAKAFSPASIQSGGSSTVTLTLTNPNSVALTNASFTDTLLNMSALGGAVGGSCTGTTPASLVAGATALSFSGITIPANGNCTVTFAVTSSVLGVQPNATSGVTTTQTPAAGTVSNTANLTVYGPPTIAKAFSPAMIASGGSSTVTLTLTNPNATALTNASFTDTLVKMVAVGGAVGGTCAGTTPASLTAGATALSFSGITIPASGSCTVTFGVTSNQAGINPNSTSGVTTTQTPVAGAVSNTANLTVVLPPTITKSFNPASVLLNQASILTITITNPAANPVGLTGIAVTDAFPAGVQVAATPAATNSCGGTFTAAASTTTVSLSGGAIATAGASCSVSVAVIATTSGTKTNVTGTVASTEGGTGGTATATLFAVPEPTAAVTGTATICAGQFTTITAALTGATPWTLTWSDGLVQTVASSPATRSVSPTFDTTYKVTSLTDANYTNVTTGLTGQAVITVKPTPSSVIHSASSVCAGSSGNTASVADAGPGATYAWSLTNATPTTSLNTTAVSFTAGSSGAVVITVSVNLNGCVSISTVTLPVDHAPSAPVPTIPSNGSTYQGAFVSWSHSGGAVYDVYFDTENPPQRLLAYGLANNFDAAIPVWFPGVTYYWQVAARNACGRAVSPVQSFTAGACPWSGQPPALIAPIQGASNQLLTTTLQWSAVVGAARYDVYLGTTSSNLSLYRSLPAPQLSETVRLQGGQTYFWKVVATPVCGTAASAPSAIQEFTTQANGFTLTSMAPAFVNRWQLGQELVLSGAGFLASSQLFTDYRGAAAGTLAPSVFTNSFSTPTSLAATLTPSSNALAGRYDSGVVDGGIEMGRLLQSLVLRTFTDVFETDYYFESSSRVADAGVMESDSDPVEAGPQFHPSANVNRAAMAEYLARTYQFWRTRSVALPPATCTTPDFPDVPCSHPNWLAIHWIKTWAITVGVPCGQGVCFNPDGTLTRAEFITFLDRMKQPGVLANLLATVGETDPGCSQPYPACSGWTDAGMKVATWPRREANVGYADRLTRGCAGAPGNNLAFCPYDLVTRAQIGEFLARLLGLVTTP